MSERSVSPPVYGIETEYSCLVSLPGGIIRELVGSCHSVDARLGLYVQPPGRGTSGITANHLAEALATMGIYRAAAITDVGMLSNGGRLYMDPSGPEYASPETARADDAVYRSFDGDDIVMGVFEYLRREGVVQGYQLNRRVVDHNRTSRGIHLNTTTNLGRDPDDLIINSLATLNVVKGAMFGSGGLLLNRKGETSYHHSPRLSLTTNVSAPYSQHRRRPLVRYPFKPDGTRLSRIETVTSDALNFAWPLRASLVVTNALVGLLELGYGYTLPRLKAPKDAAHLVGRYGNKTRLRVLDSHGEERRMRPLGVLRQICEAVLDVDDKERHLDKESAQVLEEVIELSDAMSSDILNGAKQVESVARLVSIQTRMDDLGLRLDSERICRFDYYWDMLGGGLAETLRNRGNIGWQGFDTPQANLHSSNRLKTPPRDTRAFLRGNRIGQDKGANASTWDHIDFGDEILYVHPLATQRPGY